MTTKREELQAIAELARALGPDSYLGPWLQGSLPWLRSCLESDYIPEPADRLQAQACRVRTDAISEAAAIRADAQDGARRTLDDARETADRIAREAQDAKDRAWEAIRQAMRQLEA